MKTTIELPDALLHEAQQIAGAQGTTLNSLLEEGLRAAIARRRRSQQFELRAASVDGRGLNPELAAAGWAQIQAVSYGTS
jgi:predicted transcriptional regulator